MKLKITDQFQMRARASVISDIKNVDIKLNCHVDCYGLQYHNSASDSH